MQLVARGAPGEQAISHGLRDGIGKRFRRQIGNQGLLKRRVQQMQLAARLFELVKRQCEFARAPRKMR